MILFIIQARMSSKRLPGKVLAKIKDQTTILDLILRRLKKLSYFKKKYIIATSNQSTDIPLIEYCKKKKINYYAGSLENVALRFFKIIKIKKISFFVRINGDSPFIDPSIINRILIFAKKKKFDICTNVFPRSYPKGQSVEIIKKTTFLKYFPEIKKKSHKEHLTSFFYANSNLFKIKNFKYKKDFSKKNMSIDTQKDFLKAQKVFNRFGLENLAKMSWTKILKVIYEK